MRRRIVDDVDDIHAGHARGGSATRRGTATRRHDLVLYRFGLWNGDDDHHRRCG